MENTEPEGGKPEQVDPREQMRIALEKKNQRSKAGSSHEDGRAKADHAQGRAGSSKMFRRKSGG
jgi:hypothetical protein